MQKLISIDLFADFGMLKKPDTNEPVYLTFNMLHKPALLGILGAITGESGFKEKGKLPDYYLKLKDLKVGIRPLDEYHEKGNFQKTIITYNNTTGMASKEEGGNLMVTEQTLVAPAFRCYLLLDMQDALHTAIDENLKNYHAEYLPYLGKNEFSVWWENYKEYQEIINFDFLKNYQIRSIFYKNEAISNYVTTSFTRAGRKELGNRFIYFERLPVAYNTDLYQYDYADFVFTNAVFDVQLQIENIKAIDNEAIIQLF